MYQVAIIGCGSIAQVHAKVLSGLQGVQLAACADIRPERARAMADSYGLRAFDDWEKMLDAMRPDAVHLCTPHYLHPLMAERAAQRGIAVFTEKPPAIDRAGWQKVREAAEKAPVGICFQNRYHPAFRELLRARDTGEYGALRGIRAFVTWNRPAGYYTSSDWKGTWEREGGGALINQAIHTLDLITCILGAPDTVEATMARHRLKGVIQVEDTAEVMLLKGGVPALLYASNDYGTDAPVILECAFEKAALRFEGDTLSIITDGQRTDHAFRTDEALGRSYWGACHKACIADFYRSVREGTPFMNAPDGCDDTMRTLLSVYERAGRSF